MTLYTLCSRRLSRLGGSSSAHHTAARKRWAGTIVLRGRAVSPGTPTPTLGSRSGEVRGGMVRRRLTGQSRGPSWARPVVHSF